MTGGGRRWTASRGQSLVVPILACLVPVVLLVALVARAWAPSASVFGSVFAWVLAVVIPGCWAVFAFRMVRRYGEVIVGPDGIVVLRRWGGRACRRFPASSVRGVGPITFFAKGEGYPSVALALTGRHSVRLALGRDAALVFAEVLRLHNRDVAIDIDRSPRRSR